METNSGEAVAPSRSRVVDSGGRAAGRLDLSVTSATAYAGLLADATGFDVMLTQNGRVIAGTLEGDAGRTPPTDGETEIDGKDYRVTGFELPAFDAGTLGVHVLVAEEDLQDAISENTLGIFLILVAFLIFGIAFALTAARSHAAADDAPARRGQADRQGQLLGRGADRGQRRVRRARHGVQLDGAPARARLEELQLERARLQGDGPARR